MAITVHYFTYLLYITYILMTYYITYIHTYIHIALRTYYVLTILHIIIIIIIAACHMYYCIDTYTHYTLPLLLSLFAIAIITDHTCYIHMIADTCMCTVRMHCLHTLRYVHIIFHFRTRPLITLPFIHTYIPSIGHYTHTYITLHTYTLHY
jgi:hypothetical protein